MTFNTFIKGHLYWNLELILELTGKQKWG